MKMKKFLIIISAAVMSLCFTACAGNDNTNVGSQSTGSVQTSLSSETDESESNAEVVQTSSSSETAENESMRSWERDYQYIIPAAAACLTILQNG